MKFTLPKCLKPKIYKMTGVTQRCNKGKLKKSLKKKNAKMHKDQEKRLKNINIDKGKDQGITEGIKQE